MILQARCRVNALFGFCFCVPRHDSRAFDTITNPEQQCCSTAAVLKALISLLAALRRHHAKNGMTATMMAQALGPLVLRPEQNAAAQDNMDLVVDEAVSSMCLLRSSHALL